jgi:hypothetical protein
VSNVITLGREELSKYSRIEEPFDCYDMLLNTPLAVRAGDIIGACVEVNNQSQTAPIDLLDT